MSIEQDIANVCSQYITEGSHKESDYFKALKILVADRGKADDMAVCLWQQAIDRVYSLVQDEILTNKSVPVQEIKFGTSGWRGMLGKDIFIRSVATVTAAILQVYRDGEQDATIRQALGVDNFTAMQQRGCVIGFDNRFGGDLLALAAINVLAANGVKVLYAGEATTGILSASVLVHNAAFSINLTPSHNPMEYGGFKYNAADAGPAATILTDAITRHSRDIVKACSSTFIPTDLDLQAPIDSLPDIISEDALKSWQQLVGENAGLHGLQYTALLSAFAECDEAVVCVDTVHGASREYIRPLLGNPPADRLIILRSQPDVTFGGIAPEPSSANMQPVMQTLKSRKERLKVGAIIDPDGDRIRFTDGSVEISMNQFGAMAYHFFHEVKGKPGIVAKTVASSNFANAVAAQLGEDVFEPRVGFKEFKPVIGKALVYFEESDGISVIGHTPEKDAFIGLIVALDMVLTLNKSLGEYLAEIEAEYGHFYPDRDGVEVAQKGEMLINTLEKLKKYGKGTPVKIGEKSKTIREVITIDGRKMIFEDQSWLMIRPSGTEPKVRFYVEARSPEETADLVKSAKSMLAEIGLLP